VDTQPVTLRTLAEQLGLHVSTVSRVLHAKPDEQLRAASEATVARIRTLADELGYRPNPHATSLRTRRSNLVGVLVPRLSDIVLATIYEGIEEAAAEHGLSTFVTNTRDIPAAQRARTEMVLARRVDGMIFGDAYVDGRFLDEVAAPGRAVRAGQPPRRAARVGHLRRPTRAAGSPPSTLLARGHRSVAVIAGEPYASTGIDRTAGFVDTYQRRRAADPARAHPALPVRRARRPARRRGAARAGRRPTAIFAVNDFAAIGALGAARDLGLLAGTDLAVVGFNDTPLAAELPIALTTVRSPMHEMGRRRDGAAGQADPGRRGGRERLRPELMVRASSGADLPHPTPAPAADPHPGSPYR